MKKFAVMMCVLMFGLAVPVLLVCNAQAVIDIESPTADDVPMLVDALGRSGSDYVEARGYLIELGSEAVPGLLEAMKEGRNAWAVGPVLADIRDESAIEPLSRLITDKNPEVADNARGALKAYGDEAVPALAAQLKDPDRFSALIDVLMYAEPSAASLKLVRGLAGSVDVLERAGAGYLLGFWKDTESSELVEKLMADKERVVRENVIHGYEVLFSEKPDRYNQKLLIELLKDESPVVRGSAAVLLSHSPSDEAVRALLYVLQNDKDQRVRTEAVVGLEMSRDPMIVLPLIEVLREDKPDHGLLSQSLYLLGELEAKEAGPYIVGLFEKGHVDDAGVQQEAFDALAKIGEPVDMKLFLPYLKVGGGPHEDSLEQLLQMMEKIGEPGDAATIEALVKFQKTLSHPMRIERVQRTIDALK